jgi:SPX domain protein involved in polyphosphate accumulation
MKFGNQLKLRIENNSLWSNYYVDYIKLKEIIKKMKLEKDQSKKKLYKETHDSFFKLLKEEREKFTEWYLKIELQCQIFLKEIESKFKEKKDYNKQDHAFICSFSEKIFSLKDFKKVNYISFEKIIKKFKKQIEGENEEILKFEKEFKENFIKLSSGLEGIESKIHVRHSFFPIFSLFY